MPERPGTTVSASFLGDRPAGATGLRTVVTWLKRIAAPGRLPWLALTVVIAAAAIALSSWFIYNAIFEWRRNSALLAERRASVVAHLLLEAIVRDMRGVHETVLSSAMWSEFGELAPFEYSNFVASAFARYPYPESFFVWHPRADSAGLVFFNRSDRRPAWLSTPERSTTRRFPVTVAQQPAIDKAILNRLLQDATEGRRVSVFEMPLGGSDYQVVAEINYADGFQDNVSRITGFTVNLPWVRTHYFTELTRQVAEITGDDGAELSLAVFDDAGMPVVGHRGPAGDPLTRSHEFPLAFFDPGVMAFRTPPDLAAARWTVEVSASDDPALAQAIRASNRTLVIATSAAVTLIVGLALTVRAERTHARLSDLRADFIASVTHELKTPIASIRAAAETLARGRGADRQTVRDYSMLVIAEAKRLTRLVENLLAQSRIADVTDAYTFESIDLSSLFDDITDEFRGQLTDLGFTMELDVPADLPRVRGDELSLRLLFGNLIDNAMKYSGGSRWIAVRAHAEASHIVVEVADRGIGIPANELDSVTRKFVRGRHAPPGGSGLGLAIAGRIARDHGGSLSLQSEVAAGTTVSVRLPLVTPV